MKSIDPTTLKSFAPSGTLRVGINLGNPVLASEDAATKKLSGISVDIADEIGKRINLPIQLIPFKSAGATVDGIKNGGLDMVFVAIDLYLTREIKKATLLRATSSQAVIDDFMSGKGNVAAGVKQQLESDAKRYEGLRMLPGRFMVINQSIGIPKARPDFEKTTAYLSEVITQLKQSGFVANSMQRHHIQGAKVAE